MWSDRTARASHGLAILAGAWLAFQWGVCARAESDSAARVRQAAAEEKAVHDEWNAKEMARSATREIAVVARATAEKAGTERAEAVELLKRKRAEAAAAKAAVAANQDPARQRSLQQAAEKAEAVAAEAAQACAQKTAAARAMAEQMITDQGVANRAVDALRAIEQKLGQKMAALRCAERAVLAADAEAAQCAAEKALAECLAAANALKAKACGAGACAKCAAAEKDATRIKAAQQAASNCCAAKAAAEQLLFDKAAAAETASKKARQAKRKLAEADAVAAWEAQQWLTVEQSTLQQHAAGNANACQVATALAAAETDAKHKQKLTAFAAQTNAEKTAAEQTASAKANEIRKYVAVIYPLRVAALGGLKPLAPESWDYAKARHLIVRAGFGGTPDEVAKLHALGLYQAVDYLVDFYKQPAANVPFDAVPPLPSDPLEAKLRNPFVRFQAAGARGSVESGQLGRLRQWWMKRMVESPRPLQEKLTLFWHGHFATQYSVVHSSFAIYHQNQLLREHAAGNFGGLLYAIVHDPGMLRYLDNNTNVKGHANENLAREIMELFSMGAYQGYNEKDVREAARALTGYTFDAHTGQFRFAGSTHDETPKTIFGQTGNFTGDDVVRLILEQPSTSRFLARKLFEFFAYQDPGDDVTESLASVLKAYNYELTPLLKNLFLSEEFYSPRTMGTQIKCPVQLVVGTLHDLGVKKVTDAGALLAAAREMGQELFEPPDVKGWRYGRPWINSNRIFVRYNGVSELVRSVSQPGGRQGVDAVALLDARCCSDSAQVVEQLARACLSKPLSDRKRKELAAYLGTLPPASEWTSQRDVINQKLQGVLVLMTSMPEYQVY